MINKTKKKAIIIRADTLDRETRATKLINALTNGDYLVTLLCWDRGFKASRSERSEAGDFHREIRLNFKVPLMGKAVLPLLPIWWCYIFFWLMVTNWDIAHAIQIVSIPPAVIAGKIKSRPVIYEMLDTYEDAISLPIGVRNACVKIDRLFMRLASCVILADVLQIEEVGGIPNSKVIVISDSPDTVSRINLDHRKNDTFALFFAGALVSEKLLNLDRIITAIESIDDVKIVIAGYGDLVNEIKEWSRKMPDKIQFIGEITHAEVLERSAKADLLFMLRSPLLPVNKYICGSKVLEAMMCGTPILVNKGTSTAHKVREEKCGLVVDANNVDEIKRAIIKLRDDPELCEELGANAIKAYEERYSWEIMRRRLLGVYHELTSKDEQGA